MWNIGPKSAFEALHDGLGADLLTQPPHLSFGMTTPLTNTMTFTTTTLTTAMDPAAASATEMVPVTSVLGEASSPPPSQRRGHGTRRREDDGSEGEDEGEGPAGPMPPSLMAGLRARAAAENTWGYNVQGKAGAIPLSQGKARAVPSIDPEVSNALNSSRGHIYPALQWARPPP